MNPQIIAGALVVAPVAVWFGVYGLALLATRPETPSAAPATEDLGPEPPAIASLVVNHWEVTEDAAESTLLDLAARHILEIRQPGNDPMQTTIHIRQPNPAELRPYEQRVFDRVAGLASGGVVPLTALTFRDAGQAASWSKRLAADVIADAREHGLSQRRLGTGLVSGLVAAAGAAAAVVAAGVLYWLGRAQNHDTGSATLAAGAITWFVLGGVATRAHGERDTAAGREVASRWLGVRAWLRGHDAFGDLPPAAVTVWDRYLSYGAAVGATRVSSAVIDLGMGSRRNVWSSYGGTATSATGQQPANWHRIRVHYPRFWRRYGVSAPRLILHAVIAGALGYVLVRYWYPAIGAIFSDASLRHNPAQPYVTLIKSIGLLAGIVGLGYAIYVVIRTAVDLAAPATITGQVVWVERWRAAKSGYNNTISLRYLAVDDGSSDQTRAWALPSTIGAWCSAGDTVTFTVRRWSRRVQSLTVNQHARQQIAAQDAYAASVNTEQMIAQSMGVAPTGGREAGPPLLTADEVSAALGAPVNARRADRPAGTGPVDVAIFRGPDGTQALTLLRSSGTVARMTFRLRQRQGEPVAGLGDEARGGPGWIAIRRGDETLLLNLAGAVAQSTPPMVLYGLAQTAVARLPAQAPR
ncbi:MAG TPA: hypothetical protein VGF84_07930 [Micromonosporaceae bacterium]|jgi:hypothetical protein